MILIIQAAPSELQSPITTYSVFYLVGCCYKQQNRHTPTFLGSGSASAAGAAMAMARTEARTARVSFMVMVMVSGDQRLEDSCPRPGLCFIPPCFSEFPERQIFLVSGKLSGQAPPCTALPSGFCLRSSVWNQVRGRSRFLN